MNMNYSTYKSIIDNKHLFYFNNATGAGDLTTDPVIKNNPNNFLAPIVNNESIMKTLTFVALMLSIIVSTLIIIKYTKK